MSAVLSYPADQVVVLLEQIYLPFFRVAAFFMVVPIIGSRLVPMRIRLLLAVMVTFAVSPSIELRSYSLFDSLGFLLIAKEVMIGLVLGFSVQIFFHIASLAGQIMSMQMGLGFASLVDPSNGISVAAVSQYFLMVTTLLFLSFDGHLALISVFISSFQSIPVDLDKFNVTHFYVLAEMGGWLFSSALSIAMPAVIALFVANFAFGVMSKAAPQLNIFAIGFPLTLMYGLIILWLSLLYFLPRYEVLMGEFFDKFKQFLI